MGEERREGKKRWRGKRFLLIRENGGITASPEGGPMGASGDGGRGSSGG